MAVGGVSFTFKTAKLEAKIRRRLAETPLAERQIMHQIAVFIEGKARNRAPAAPAKQKKRNKSEFLQKGTCNCRL